MRVVTSDRFTRHSGVSVCIHERAWPYSKKATASILRSWVRNHDPRYLECLIAKNFSAHTRGQHEEP